MATPGPGEHERPSGELADLGAGLREEWRNEQERVARDAAEQWHHERSLRDAVLEWLHRGDGIVVDLGDQRFSGEVIDVGDDLVAVRTDAGRVDVHVDASVPLALRPERRSEGGARPTVGPRSFRAALLERESSSRVIVGTTLRIEPLLGTLVVGRDHVRVIADSGGETFVPFSAVSYVCRVDDDG